MKPLLYHLEYHIQNGYFEDFPKGQGIKMLIASDGGVQALHGRGTGSGRVMFSSGKSVLFAMDPSKEMAKVVFRVYSADEFIGEAMKAFKGTTFPKRTEVGEPGSYTFGVDLGFRKNGEIIGATKAFIRMTAFGENIISECVKDGESYRVRMTSLIVERNSNQRKNVKPWWVILDGRRLRFSRWLKALEKENCTKEVYLNIKKSRDEERDLASSCGSFLSQEDRNFVESAEASLEKDFNYFRNCGYPETEDKGSQVKLDIETSFREFSLLPLKVVENLQADRRLLCENNYSFYSLENEATLLNLMQINLKDGYENKCLGDETVMSLHTEDAACSKDNEQESPLCSENTNIFNENYNTTFIKTDSTPQEINNNTVSEENIRYPSDCGNTREVDETNRCTPKSDDISHFEGSRNDVIGETVSESENSSNIISLFSEEKCTVYDVTETLANSTATEKSFLPEAIVREVIDILSERIFEVEYNNTSKERSENGVVFVEKENSTCKIPRYVGYGDTESSLELSLGITETKACIDLSTATTLNLATEALKPTKFDRSDEGKERTEPENLNFNEKPSEGLTSRDKDHCSDTNESSDQDSDFVFNNIVTGSFTVHRFSSEVEHADVSSVRKKVHFQTFSEHGQTGNVLPTGNQLSESEDTNRGATPLKDSFQPETESMLKDNEVIIHCLSEEEDIQDNTLHTKKESEENPIHKPKEETELLDLHRTSGVKTQKANDISNAEEVCVNEENLFPLTKDTKNKEGNFCPEISEEKADQSETTRLLTECSDATLRQDEILDVGSLEEHGATTDNNGSYKS